MKDTLLSLLCAIAVAQAGITVSQNARSCNPASIDAQRICKSENNENALVAHRLCNMFYKCSNGRAYPYDCPSILLYDPVKEECDWPHLVECGDRPIGDSDDSSSNDTDCIDDDEGSDNDAVTILPPITDNDSDGDNGGGTCNCNPDEAPSICAAENSNGILISHENCNQFYICAEGVPVALVCPGDLLYNPYTEQCDYKTNVDCGDRIIPKPEEDNGDIDNDENNIIGGGNCDPSQAPSICAAADSDGILIAHENCNQFYMCSGGVPVAISCPPNLLFNPHTDRCEWAANVECEDRVIPDVDDNDSADKDNDNHDNDGNNPVGGGNCDPSQAPTICAASDSDGVLVAHEKCNKFYKCFNGKPVAIACPDHLLFNPNIDQCDWPENVDCGDRLISDPEDNNNIDNDNNGNDNGNNDNDENDNGGTCNCNPGEAPSICAADDSDGILVAHENCNQFYKCDHGKPVVFTCPPNTKYNPYKEQCDWADNVDCGDRVIPDPDDNDDANDNNDNDNGGNDSDNGGNDNDTGENDNGGNDNGGTCNCNPGEAPSICAAEDSDGILVAHENCNQFYKCDHGKPVVFTCPPNTKYNPYKEQCDWAHSVDCGDRVIPDSNETGEENDNNDNGGGDSDSEGDIDDNLANDPENDGTCNCSPEEAPSICAAENSDGILVAHENCNQFYKCDHGKPVVFTCPPNTKYNPYKEECDWASNVDCGDRVIPDPDDNDDSNDSGDNDNGNNDNGGNDSDTGGNDNGGNDNGGTCNCNPGEAPSICAGEDSDGVLVAHENCNQFYKCDHGKPVVFTCPPNTKYNPYKEECDWAHNVDCGDRVIPDENDSNDDNDNGSSDNDDNNTGGNDNGGNDNSGTCNCNPGEAPSICAAEDSDGILVAHENCNQFYKCDHGKPVVFTCPPNTKYNPYKEECDWASNVDCGDRVIPDPDDNDDSNDSGDNDNGNNDNGGNDSDTGGNDNGGNDNGGTCNCNPGEAPSICAGEDSDGVLVAHENCNQFYKCDHGKPVVFTCPPNTKYNPYKEECDWAHNVDCGDRVIPDENDSNDGNDNGSNDNGDNDTGGNDTGGNDNGGNDNGGTCNCNPGEAPSICAAEDSDGILVAHENCNQFYKCDHGKPVVFTCPPNTKYNPYKEECDWASNVDCGDRVIPDEDDSDDGNDNGGNDNGNNDNGGNDSDTGGNDNGGNDNGGTCNCNPGEAPSICAGENSDGVLVAHENCNQFYKCDHGKPVVFTCPPNTKYNPYKEECDWAHNVDCGDRVIPDENDSNDGNDNGSNDNGDNDTGGNDTGGNDNGGNDNGGTCNCNPGEAPSICAAEDSDGILVAHENCNQFYKCDHGKPVVFTCPPNTKYNPYKEECDWASNVDCGDRIIPDSNENGGENDSDNNDNDKGEDDSDSEGDIDDNLANDPENDGTCNCKPEEAPLICAAENSDGILVAHENCNQFYKCDHGKPVVFTCPSGTLYNPHKEQCDWASNVDCGDRVIPDPDDNDGSNESADNDNGNNDNGGNDNGDNENGGTCNCNPGEAPSICAGEDSDGVLVAHENCNQFYKCDHGKPVVFTCPPNTKYNPYKEECDWAHNVDCGDRVIPDENDSNDGNDSGSNDNGDNDNGGNDNDTGGNDSGGNDNGGTCNCNPGEAPSICAAEDSDGILVAHENCNKFYKCDHGKPVVFTCPPNTMYNPYKEQCDWADNVDCGDRVIPDEDDSEDGNDNGGNDNGNNDNGGNDNDTGGNDNGGNDNGGTCNCNPGEAPSICAAEDSDGILVAHENCNQFYKCDHGKPVVFTCPPNTKYNPYKEQCDWADDVDCGDRVIPDEDDSDDGNDNGGNDNGNNDNGGNDNDTGGNDNGGNDNGGTCNCNPGEAPSICAAEDSDGILVAHENCNQFYKCDHGKPVVFTCPPNTKYNPYKEQCDWAHSVECGDRVIPDSNETGEENDNNDNGGGDSDSEGDIDDNLANDPENDGTCNCSPEEAPSICAAENSNGILVAHENCNQFYKCDHGKPVIFTCPPNTKYNPYKEKCDWASNVDCGDRVIPDPDDNDDSNDSGDNDNGNNDNGDNDSDNGGNESSDNDNGGTCNCNPEEAPSICAAEDSDGILVAHENCNQFYKCDHGKPIVFTCPPDTKYNPYKEQCDWADNVDCGDRVIPDPDDNDDANDNNDNDNGGNDSDNGGNDNDTGGNDNGGNDNGGTCNCNPGEAPSICATEDSDGILVAHENCNQFYKCDHGKPVVFTCPPNTKYNPYKEQCDWAHSVDCGDRVIPDSNETGEENDNNDNGGGDSDSEGDIDDNLANDPENDGTCNCSPEEAPSICAAENSDGILVAHENCNQFYKCDHGKPVIFTCPPNTKYNPYKEKCDWASNVDCGDRVVPDPDDNDDSNDSGDNDNGNNDNGDNDSDNGGNESSDNDNGGTCNCNPEEAPSICAAEDSDGILVAHENCNQFYKCDHGKPIVFTCPPDTKYNPYKEQCDWADNVDCGDRVIPDPDDNDDANDNNDNDNGGNDSDNGGNDNDNGGNDNDNGENDNDNGGNDNDNSNVSDGNGNDGIDTENESNDSDCDGTSDNDNDGTCNCNPEQAPTICAGYNSNGVLIAHEYCNQFYQCSSGNPVAFTCPDGLLYNPVKEECDWAIEVDCGDRLIPDPNEEDVSSDSDDTPINDPEDVGSCNCNPGEAPSICASDNSDGSLIAHENCNHFYICSNGLPVALKCPGNTLYNPYQERCDWASNVECGERVIPDSEEEDNNNDSDIEDENNNVINDDPSQAPAICAETGSDGTLVAHENCNQFYQCSNGLPIAINCNEELLFNPATQRCDWSHNVDCGDRNVPETDGECACNPRNAPTLCSKEHSNGKLIAHENCHQFYVCVDGVPLASYCPSTLVYNIKKEACDWPQNVDCYSRNIITYSSVNKHFESRQTLRK